MEDDCGWELVKMNRHHISEVALLDSKCYTNSLAKSVFRKAVNSSIGYSWVVESKGEVLGYIVALDTGDELAIDRIGYRHKGGASIVRAIMSWVCFCCEEMSLQRAKLYVSEDQLSLRSILNELGFYAYRVSSAPGGSRNKSLLVKQMRESTWLEKTHYPEGDRVIDEILNGDGRVIATQG